jgi:cell division septation protein DedD
MTSIPDIRFREKVASKKYLRRAGEITLALSLALTFSACATNLQTKVSGNLGQLSKNQTVAILPVEIVDKGQKETAALFRQTLYANLQESDFNLLEPYIVDGLLKQNNLTDPAQFLHINPMQFTEILGADAVLISRINKVERSYMIVHSSIEIGVSVQMVDTRTGEILWRAEQTESDFQGIGKIPTGIFAAAIGPARFVTNKLNLRRMTSKLVDKLTAVIKEPSEIKEKETFEKPLIASTATRDLEKVEDMQDLEAEWAADVAAYTEVPKLKENSTGTESDPKYDTESSGKDQPKLVRDQMGTQEGINKPAPETEEMKPVQIHWTPRKEKSKPKPKPAESTETILSAKTAQPTTIATPELETKPQPRGTYPALAQYTIQVGAYKAKVNAERMMHTLTSKGYKAYITPHAKDGTTIFKVNVEKFENKEQAYNLARTLTQKENLKNFVVTVNPGSS